MRARLPLHGVRPGRSDSAAERADVLGQADAWDPVTAGVVLARLGPMPPLRFFTPDQEAIARPLFDLLLDQREEPRIPVFEMVDARLAELMTDGWHYHDLPPDPQAWIASLEALDADAEARCGTGFSHCSAKDQEALLQAITEPGDGDWHSMAADRVWSLWTRYACTGFYAHPWAWNEIGFPGPAYPRGYKNSGINRREPFEVAEPHPVDPVQPR